MDERDQSAAIAFLADPASHGGRAVERLSTHGAHVFLAGERAYKIKRAVDLGYFDFTTLARRRHFLGRELDLNRATAPTLYLGLRTVARDASGRLAWDGAGEVVEWVLDMRRFDQASLFDRMAREGRLTPRLIDRVADAVARLHRDSPPRRDFGGVGAYAAVIDGAAARFAALPVFRSDEAARLLDAARRELARRSATIEDRRDKGFVRRGHGDLHLRNICLVDGAPTLFDCLEFDDALAVADVCYDLAFLVMDLCHRGRSDLAARALGRYLAWTDDFAGLALLSLFLALRAIIRAHVVATMGEAEEARTFFAEAARFLAPAKPVMIAVGGLSGTGKSTLAAALAPFVGPAPGAAVLRSDVLRKRLFGAEPEARLPPEAYAPGTSEKVYARLIANAEACLAAGHGAIVDAVSARPEERAAFETAARRAGVPFVGLWLAGDRATLAARIADRPDDASDATVAVLDAQRAHETGPMTWRVLDAARPLDAVLADARAALDLGQGPP